MSHLKQPVPTPVPEEPTASFHALGIAPKILDIIDKMKFVTPTPIQHKAIPIAIRGEDVIGVAQTGTGKTLAFAIPIIQKLAETRKRALVLVPTRELAIQVEATFLKLSGYFNLKTAVLIGGASMFNQVRALRMHPNVIIATPGRLNDHLNRKTENLANVNILVLDEADRMLDMGFLPQIDHILKSLPKEKQTMLFSATIPKEVVSIARNYMKLPVHVEIAPPGSVADLVTQELFIVRRENKNDLLVKLLKQYTGAVLVFSATKIGAAKINRTLKAAGHRVAEIHSDRSLAQRKEALDGFKRGRYRILVATDIAARGIDVTGIELVVNFDIPEDTENYVHRIGRTARAGKEGHAISFATPDQKRDILMIEKLIKTTLPISKHPELPEERFLETFGDGGGKIYRRGNFFSPNRPKGRRGGSSRPNLRRR